MNPAIQDKPLMLNILPNIVAFGIGLAIAYFLEWETTDLVWSLWLCSLVLGYLTLLSAIGGGAYFGYKAIMHESFSSKYLLPTVAGGLAFGIFFLGFFSLHFCGFHAGHSVFLQQFFPLQGMPDDGFGAAFMNPMLLWIYVFEHLIKPYGIFLIPALIVERKHVFKFLIGSVRTVEKLTNKSQLANPLKDKKTKDSKMLGDVMSRPYKNVIRMHLLIFFFGFCHFLELDSFFVYAVVYFVYFFPWNELKALKKDKPVETA